MRWTPLEPMRMRLRCSVVLTALMILPLGHSAQAQSPRSPVLSSPRASASNDQQRGDPSARGPRESRPPLLETSAARQQLSSQGKQIESLTNQVELLSLQRDRAQFRTALSADGDAAPGKAVVEPLSSPLLGAPAATELQQTEVALQNLRQQQQAAPLSVSPEELQKQLELQRKQIEVLEKMVRLLAGQIERQSPALTDVQTQVASLQAHSQQAAQRDQQLASGIDNLTDQLDAQLRNGPRLPSQLKEYFLPGGTNETPLAIYGSTVINYSQVNGQAGSFDSPAFSPYFLLQLNNKFLLEAAIDLGADGALAVSQTQVDWLVSDSATVVVGRYLTPIGFFHERLDHEWINKLTDAPLMFNQVSPLLSTNGLQLRGSRYAFGSPAKVEYSLYAGNSARLGTNLVSPPNQQVTDLAAITSGPGTLDALGGRLGMWIPELGVNLGMSGYSQGAYASAAKDHFELYGFDASYHYGNWDARFEFAQNFQQAASYIGNNIRRSGLYAQLAYRNYQHRSPIVASLEVVGRFSMARFSGIDPTQIDLTAFAPGAAPVNRNQYNLGLNYYFYPSMILKFAYEWNPALGDISLNDNTFMSQYVWAF